MRNFLYECIENVVFLLAFVLACTIPVATVVGGIFVLTEISIGLGIVTIIGGLVLTGVCYTLLENL